MTRARVVVIGAGIGGLACALRLATRGLDVTVLEKGAASGGKLREVTIGQQRDGVRADAGPTVLTMRWVFDACFDEAGASFAERVPARPAATLARHAWDERAVLDLHADPARSADAIARFAGTAEAKRYDAFRARARSIYRVLEKPFLESAQPNPLSLARRVGLRGLGDLTRISPFATMWSELGEYFHDPRLRQLFGRYATYCGSSPFTAPATLMLVAHVEQEGVWLVEEDGEGGGAGGMHRIAEAFAALIVERGGRIRCDREVAEIVVSGGAARGVRLADGETIDADAVVFNGDTAALAAGLAGAGARGAVPPTRREERSLSAITWHVLAKTSGLPLLRHTVLFGADSRREFDDLFVRRRVPDDPTVYVCAQDRGADADAASPDAPERLMLLINAPADADEEPLTDAEIERCRTRMMQRLSASGLELDEQEGPMVTTTPSDFARLFPATGGALYGRATHGWKASFDRPSSTSRIPRLYLAGGSVHPGPGLPMAALSGRLAAQALMDDLDATTRRASTSTSSRTAMRGGTSMR